MKKAFTSSYKNLPTTNKETADGNEFSYVEMFYFLLLLFHLWSKSSNTDIWFSSLEEVNSRFLYSKDVNSEQAGWWHVEFRDLVLVPV